MRQSPNPGNFAKIWEIKKICYKAPLRFRVTPLTCNGVAPSRKPLADKLVFTLSRKRPGNA